VRTVSLPEAIQVTEARQALEGLIAAAAARNASDAERAELDRIGTDMSAAVADDRPGRYSELNERFHRRLREMSGHDVAAELVATLRARTVHQPFRLALVPGRPQQSLHQHLAIIDAIVNHEPEAAQAAMAEHLGSVLEALHHLVADSQAETDQTDGPGGPTVG
jgi:DNA-binding GntR family transcriptional regulator